MSALAVQGDAKVAAEIANPQPRYTPPPDRILSRVLIVATTACAILSLIPPLRLAGSIALRSVSFLSSTEACKSCWGRENTVGKVILCAKIAAVIAGVVALSASMPFLVVASLVGDTALQAIELVNNIYHFKCEEWQKVVMPSVSILVNAFALAGILAGSWPLMVTAASVSAAAMLTFAIIRFCYADNKWNLVDGICYVALSAIGIATAVTTAEISSTEYRKRRFHLENKSKYEMRVYDKKTEVLLVRLKPDEKFVLDLRPDQAAFVGYEGPDSSYTLNLYRYDSRGTAIDPLTTIHQNALPAIQFPKLPLANALSITSTYDPPLEELQRLCDYCMRQGYWDEVVRLLEKGVPLGIIPEQLLHGIINGTNRCTEHHVKIFKLAFESGQHFDQYTYQNAEYGANGLLSSLLTSQPRAGETESHLFYKKLILKMFIWGDAFFHGGETPHFNVANLEEALSDSEAGLKYAYYDRSNPILQNIQNMRPDQVPKVKKELRDSRDVLAQMQREAQKAAIEAGGQIIRQAEQLADWPPGLPDLVAEYSATALPYPTLLEKFYTELPAGPSKAKVNNTITMD